MFPWKDDAPILAKKKWVEMSVPGRRENKKKGETESRSKGRRKNHALNQGETDTVYCQ